jgi:hypothetical protein
MEYQVMKKYLGAALAAVLISTTAYTIAPLQIKNIIGSFVFGNIELPYFQASAPKGYTAYIETGHQNRLKNSNFEVATATYAWDESGILNWAKESNRCLSRNCLSLSATLSAEAGELRQTVNFNTHEQGVEISAHVYAYRGITDEGEYEVCLDSICQPIVGEGYHPYRFIGFSQASNVVYVRPIDGTYPDGKVTDISVDIAFLGLNAKGLMQTDSLQGTLNAISDEVSDGVITIDSTGTAPTKGTTSTDEVTWSRSGQHLIATYTYYQTTTGTAGTGAYLFTLPNGLQAHSIVKRSTELSTDQGDTRVGTFSVSNGSAGTVYATGYIKMYNATQFIARVDVAGTDGGSGSSATGDAIGSGVFPLSNAVTVYKIDIRLPIEGWTNGLDAVVQNKVLDATNKNSLSARISKTGVVSEDEFDFLNGNCTNFGTSNCSFNSGIFTERPKCTVEAERSGVFCSAGEGSTTLLGTGFNCFNTPGTVLTSTTEKIITCEKTGSDINKNVIMAASLQNINSTDLCQVIASANDSESITGQTEDIPFKTIEKDTCGLWSNVGNTGNNTNDAYTANKDTMVDFSLVVYMNSGGSMEIVSYINGTEYKRHGTSDSANRGKFNGKIPLSKDDVLTFRFLNGRTLANILGTVNHHITITETADYEAIISNLSLESDRCQTKTLASTVTTTGIKSELTFNNLDTSSYYSVFSTMNVLDTTANNTGHYIYAEISGVDAPTETRTIRSNVGNAINSKHTLNHAMPYVKASASTLTFNVTHVSQSSMTAGSSITLCYKGNTVTTTEFN